MEPHLEHVSEVIIRYAKERGIGIKELAKRTGVSEHSLGDAMRRQRSFSLNEVMLLAAFFDIGLGGLFDRNLIILQLPPDTREELYRKVRRKGHD